MFVGVPIHVFAAEPLQASSSPSLTRSLLLIIVIPHTDNSIHTHINKPQTHPPTKHSTHTRATHHLPKTVTHIPTHPHTHTHTHTHTHNKHIKTVLEYVCECECV